MALADFIEIQGLARSGTDIHCKVIGRTRILLLTDKALAAQGTVDIGGSSR
jgi:hypothetical protein